MSIDKYNKTRECEYCKSYSYSSEAEEEWTTHADSNRDAERRRYVNGDNGQYPYSSETRTQHWITYLFYGILCMAALSFGMFLLFQLISLTQKDVVLESVEPTVEGYEKMDIISPEATSQKSSEMQSPTEMQNEDELKHQHYVPTIPNEMDVDEPITATTKNKPVATTRPEEDSSPSKNPETNASADVAQDSKSGTPQRELSTLEILERKNHADVVKQAQRVGVSTEGSTVEILERINHADVVKQAKRAGVSTEGSTMEILERISLADVVKQAKRAGVSTEGSTMEILERISHDDAVKQAKRAGVSTEGSTMEILERISRKELEKYNY